MSAPTFAQFMGARDQGSPARWRTEQEEFNTYPAWSEYEGPRPGPNEMSNGVGRVTCPTCHGDGYDIREGNECRACNGEGEITPTTEQDNRQPQVYRHQYPSTQTKVPFMGSLDIGARCPRCSCGTTVHGSSKRGQALWSCGSCGVLANLDAHPRINPYAPPATARLDRVAKTGTRAATARVLPMLASVHESNPALSVSEALSLVLATVNRYPEGR